MVSEKNKIKKGKGKNTYSEEEQRKQLKCWVRRNRREEKKQEINVTSGKTAGGRWRLMQVLLVFVCILGQLQILLVSAKSWVWVVGLLRFYLIRNNCTKIQEQVRCLFWYLLINFNQIPNQSYNNRHMLL